MMTIIVMLILVAVTITMAINGGLFEKAGEAVSETQDAINKEQELANGKVEIGGEWYNSIDEYLSKDKVETIPTTESYVGYYADINDDGTVDGIIYADLAFSVSGVWNNDTWSNYEYSATSNLKSYYIKDEEYDGVFNKNYVIAPINGTTGNDRFYVMALSDVTTADYTSFYWYYNAAGKLDRAVANNYNDFGAGKSNTIAMLFDWNNNTDTYGAQNTRDLWGVIQNSEDYDIVESVNDSKKWFVPSKAEWSAFGDYLYTKLGVTTSNWSTYGLDGYFWSSSQCLASAAYGANYNYGYIRSNYVGNSNYVRMSATF